MKCVLQSEEIAIVAEGGAQTVTQDLVTFIESEQQNVPEVAQHETALAKAATMGVGHLADYLSRPVRILNRTWLESDTTGYVTKINPWYEYLNSPFIKKKVDNYAWFRANLHLKVVVNASPFYYGLMMVSYNPTPDLTGANAGVNTDSYYVNGYVQRSQRPHIMVIPQDSLGGELTVPFIWPREFADLQSATEIQALGELELEILAQLASANAVVGAGVTVQIFAWLSDVQLETPSLGLALQSDEYEEATGPVSGLATSVAKFANRFTGLPFVGEFAQATAMGASAVGSIASLFGFTNVNVVEAAAPRRIVCAPPLASAQVGFPCEKLTFDPKAELSIDGAAIGLKLEDELVVSKLAQKQAIMTITSWVTSDAVDAQILTMGVNPFQYKLSTITGSNVLRMPPVSWLANMFDSWRGDLVIRFDVIASQYHRGRLLFTYDPSGTSANNVVNTPNPTGIITTHILDLGVARSIELTIPYSQALPWLRTQYSLSDSSFYSRGSDATSTNFKTDKNFFNGNLTCRVLNALTAPVSPSTVAVVVSLRGAENLEFANPRDPYAAMSLFKPQSKEEVFPAADVIESFGKPTVNDPNRYHVNFGEPVKSLRTLMQRYVRNEIWVSDADTTSVVRVDRHVMTRFPIPYGFDPYGASAATSIAATGTKNANITKTHPYNWIAPAFAGVRGSFNWLFVPVKTKSGEGVIDENIEISRVPATSDASETDQLILQTNAKVTPLSAASGAWGSQTWWGDKPSKGWWAFTRPVETAGPQNTLGANMIDQSYTTGGASLAMTKVTGGLSVTLPHYGTTLYNGTNPQFITYPDYTYTRDKAVEQLFHLNRYSFPSKGATAEAMYLDKWVGAGSDLSLLFFINTPTFFVYNSRMAPVNTAV